MFKKWFSLFLIFLLISSNFSSVMTKAAEQSRDESDSSNLFYLVSHADKKLLSAEGGTEDGEEVIPKSQEKVSFLLEGIHGVQNDLEHSTMELYITGLTSGVGLDVSVSYDFNGDGQWDRIEQTAPNDVMATNAVYDEYEQFTRNLIDVEGDALSPLENGRIQVDVWVRFGDGDALLKTGHNHKASKVMLPYTITTTPPPEEQEQAKEESSEMEVPINEEPRDNEQDENGGREEDEEHEQNEDSDLVDGDWSLTWEDNFDGDELDLSKWTIDTGNGFVQPDGTYVPGWGNEELQYYHENNVKVEDGRLILEGRKEQVSDNRGTYQYTSGKVHTQGKFSQKYGKFEAKMKLPAGQGYWPAFWMMPEHDVYGGWAASGEIDIMEAAGGRVDHIGGAIHYGGQWPNNTYTAKDYYFPEGQDITDFNVYSVEWEPGEIRWYVNGNLYQTLNNWSSTSTGNPAPFAYPAPFDQEFHLILNLAIGGWYGGNPDATTPFPGQVEVEYVRAYELTGREYREPVPPAFEVEELPSDTKQPQNGNYVYDSTFENGFTTIRNNTEMNNEWDKEFWNLVFMNDFNGSAQASVEDVSGTQFAKVNVINGGSQPYAVQLIQNITLGKGRWYKLSFDAKSNQNRTMNVKLGAGPERGYTGYSPSPNFSLTNEVQSYDLVFQMQHDSDALARLEFNLGLNTNPVWIGNVVLEEVEAVDPYNENGPKSPLSNGNHVYNGTFDQGNMDRMTFWNFIINHGSASALVSEEMRELQVAITDGKLSPSAIQVVQKGMNLLENDEYKVTFDARASSDRQIEVALLSHDGDVNYSGAQTINLTTAMEEKSFTFTMPQRTDIEGQLVFYLGGNNYDVYLDNINMVRLTNNNAKLSLDDIFPLKNGDFANGMNDWVSHVQGDHEGGTSTASVFVEDEAAKASIQNEGYEPWHVMLMQENVKLKPGNTYVVQFDAFASVDRDMEVVIENASYTRFFNEKVSLTKEVQTYQFEFEMTQEQTTGLKFLLGRISGSSAVGSAHSVIIDNVRLEVKGEREKAFPLKNGNFSNGIEPWKKHVQGEHDQGNSSKATLEVINEQAKVSVVNVGVHPWDVQLFQPELSLQAGMDYILHFDASSSVGRKVEVVIDNGAPSYHRYYETIAELTSSWQTYSFEFEMPVDDTVSLQFLLGNVAGQGNVDAHDVFFDNVRLERKGAKEALTGVKDGDDESPSTPSEPEDPNDKRWKEVGENLLIDGGFDTTENFGVAPDQMVPGWNIFNMGIHEQWAGLADFSVEQGKLNIEVKQAGWEWWHIQLLQNPNVTAGMYKIQFDMSSEKEREINVELAGSPIQTFTVTEEIQTFESIVEVGTDGVRQFMFGLGRKASDRELTTPYSMVLDNVRLVRVEEDTDSPVEQPKGPFIPSENGLVDIPIESIAQGETVDILLTNVNKVIISQEIVDALLEKQANIRFMKEENNSNIVEVTIPARNFTKTGAVEFTMEQLQSQIVQGELAVSDIFKFSLTQGEELISSFEEGYEVTLSFKVAEDVGEAQILYFNEDEQKWEEIFDSGTYDEGYISGATNHFSIFAAFEVTNEPAPGDGDDTDNGGNPGTGDDTDNGGNPGTGDDTDNGGSPGAGDDSDNGGSPGDGDDSDNGGSPGAGDDSDNGEGSGEESTSDKDKDKKLPKTATNVMNWMVVGLSMLLIGVSILIYRRKKA
ncbi:carbohydrate binding domain-containing protein [Alkalihalobacillus sp. LMS39]|uniref:carbohydrate binding domain-containing protein n=1 Tax=Alkalihalobacillus sp. LMS39 TaxID=2924032 RepID=UPI001FB2D4E9|nr:carbohydrate binding domain-containing protein [Alkalihalobacillus sp. LMS39]UOE93544.1 carbohydrate binding domain-containing protein [Alkalihalobacillus sp. LMS39]